MADSLQIAYRDARPEDLDGIIEVLKPVATIPQSNKFYEDVLAGIRNRAFAGFDKGRFNVVIAEEKRKPKTVVGAVMVQSYNIVEALEKGIIGFTMFDDIKGDHEVVVVHAIGVLNRLRRQNIGTDLFYAGVRSIAADPRVQAVMIYTPANSELCDEFFESLHFEKYGRIPKHFVASNGNTVDAAVWITSLHNLELTEYENPNSESLLDLSNPNLPSMKKKHMPKWVRDLLLQFCLPIGVVALLFIISYLLVIFGPLQGISEPDWLERVTGKKISSPTPSAGVAFHQFDGPDEYDEL